MTMKRFFLLICLLIPCILVSADEAKRSDIIEKIKLKELGSHKKTQTLASAFKDSIQDNPYDSVCTRQSLRALDGLDKFIDQFADFALLFPVGTKDFSPKNLPQDKIEKYEYYVNEMRASLGEYRALIDTVQNFTPYRSRRVFEMYSINKGKSDADQYAAVYFFDDDDNLQRYFWFDQKTLSLMYGMIQRAKDHDFTFIEEMVGNAGYKLDKKLLAFLMSEGDTKFDNSEIRELANVSSARYKNRTNSTSNGSSALSGASGQQQSGSNAKDAANNFIKTFGKKYVVTKKVCAAAYTKEALERFTQYALDDDYDSISSMLTRGELLILNEGNVVTMVDFGTSLSKVKLPNQRVVITDSSNLKAL